MPVEVGYTYHKAFRSNDRMEPDEPEGCEVLSVRAYIGGQEINLWDVVDDELREALADECIEWVRDEAENYPEPEREAA